ncbi:hypothetical protein D3C78_1877010 [compost metagenome]
MVIFAASATFFQWAVSLASWVLNSSGKEPTGISPISVRRLLSSGDLTMAATSAPSLSTMGLGVVAGRNMANQPLASRPG